MSKDAVIESWLASMSESELIDQCLFWHDMALEHGRMYNAVKAENTKLREQGARLFDKTLELGTENDRLREQASRAWRLFLKHGAVHLCDLPEVDAVRDGLRELGIELNDYE